MANKGATLGNMLADLPDFVYEFVKIHYKGESVNTQIGWAIDVRCYLNFLKTMPEFRHIERLELFTPQDLEKLDYKTMLRYKDYLRCYEITYRDSKGQTRKVEVTNSAKGIMRKLCTLRSLYGFLFKSDEIEKDITQKLELPKIPHRMKQPLTIQESLRVMDVIYHGERYFTKQDLTSYQRNRQRDIAMIVTLLGTGIRVSELVGLNMEDIDLPNMYFIVTRKGGDHQEIYMPLQVREELEAYLAERENKTNIKDEKAVFISRLGTRIAVATVERMVKRYCQAVGIVGRDKTTVHALRRTFACTLLAEGYDLKLVAELMGHKDISVTAKFYAQHNQQKHREVMHNLRLPTANAAGEDGDQ